MDHLREYQAGRFVRAHDGAAAMRSTLMTAMDQIEAVTDQIKITRSQTNQLQRLNRQLWTALEELNVLTRMVAAAELDMAGVWPLVDESETPLEILEQENVFRPDWMIFEAVEVEDAG